MTATEPNLLAYLLRRRVQLSLFFFLPVFLLLFSLAPSYIAVALLSRALLDSGSNVAPALHGAIETTRWLFGLTAAVAIASGLFVAYALVQPVRRLQRAMQGVRTGDLAAEVQIDATGELARLGEEFNRMVSTLRTHEQLERADRLAALGTLAAGLAHEIRNPLGAIRGLAQLLGESGGADPTGRYIATIQSEADRLNLLIDRILCLARPSAGTTSTFDLNRLIQDALALTVFERDRKKIVVRERYDPELARFSGDRDALLQALLNVILNAVQAVNESGEIQIETRLQPAAAAGARAVVAIANTGAPIAAADHRRIFDPFYTTKPSGTGLGLAITHQIVTAHGGAVAVASGDRTRFTIELPIR